MSGPVHRLAVVGDPISNSRSPAMHNAALRELGMDSEWSYEALHVTAEEFAERIRALPGQGYVGVNVTIPHKAAALELADEASASAREIGAANTLSFRDGSILAENTDAPGLIASIPGTVEGKRALVLGAGGAGRAAAWALDRAGASVEVWNRTTERARGLCEDIGVDLAPERPNAADYELIVNSTAVGLQGPATRNAAPTSLDPDSSPLPLPVDQISDHHVLVDLVYGEHTTELIKNARERGATAIDGIEMLVNQGAESFRIWTGIEPPLDVMRRAAAGAE